MSIQPATELSTFERLAGRVALCALRVLWTLVRLPLLALLVILEPVVRVLLAGLALLVALNALFFAAIRPLSTFPFWGMLAVAVGCVALLAIYYAVMRLLSA